MEQLSLLPAPSILRTYETFVFYGLENYQSTGSDKQDEVISMLKNELLSYTNSIDIFPEMLHPLLQNYRFHVLAQYTQTDGAEPELTCAIAFTIRTNHQGIAYFIDFIATPKEFRKTGAASAALVQFEQQVTNMYHAAKQRTPHLFPADRQIAISALVSFMNDASYELFNSADFDTEHSHLVMFRKQVQI